MSEPMTMLVTADGNGQREREEQAAARASRQDKLQVGGAAWSRDVCQRPCRELEPRGCVRS